MMRTDCRLPDYQVQGTWLREFTGWGGKVAIVRGKCGLGKVANVDLDKISRHRQVQTQRFGLSAEISQEIARRNSTRDAQDPTRDIYNFLDHDRSA